MFEMSDGQLERYHNLLEHLTEDFDEKRAKEVAMYLTASQEEIYFQNLDGGLSHEEAWEKANAIRDVSVLLEGLTANQKRRYRNLISGRFREDDAIDIVTHFTERQQENYIDLLGDGFGPDDAWVIVERGEYDDPAEEQEELEVGGAEYTNLYSGGSFKSVEDFDAKLAKLRSARKLCKSYMGEDTARKAKEKRMWLKKYDQQIAKLEELKGEYSEGV